MSERERKEREGMGEIDREIRRVCSKSATIKYEEKECPTA